MVIIITEGGAPEALEEGANEGALAGVGRADGVHGAASALPQHRTHRRLHAVTRA
jgi:hypothetical protein